MHFTQIIIPVTVYWWYFCDHHTSEKVMIVIKYTLRNIVAVPSLTLPMDRIEGITLHGSITGTVYGGAFLASGKINNALHLNGVNQEVRFHRYLDKCFHLPEVCATGSTFTYWLKWKPTAVGLIFDSGGFYPASRGYTHWLYQNGMMSIAVKTQHTITSWKRQLVLCLRINGYM